MAVSKELLKMVAREQRQRQLAGSTGVEREALKAVPQPPPHTAIVISGARRCGKSTLLLQIMRKRYRQGNFAYFDFDDERVEGLEADDLQRVLEALYEEGGEPIAFFFDEIQNAPSWELFVSRLLKGFAEQGWVKLGREQITLTDIAALKKFAALV